MNSVERCCTHNLKCLVEAQTVLLHHVNQTLQVEQSGMTLIAMIDISFDTQSFKQQHTADAQQIFLLDAILPVATIEFVGDLAVILAIEVDVGVKQIECHTAHIGFPHIGIDDAAGIRHLMNQLIAVLIKNRLDGELVEVLRLVVGDLLTVHRERLSEITVTVQEAHRGHVDATVTRLFHIVARKNTQATRIDLERIAQAIFHAEIGYRRQVLAQWLLHVFLIQLIGAVDASHHC